ncbi:MAG: purine-nucleoside phosphorylase [Bdellovibrionales bacterium GWA2_49_15]|nr:MAG: purine-nucleoside phosphorylase [Bdellovibrionales bacterium GWA2_49_15]HAZ12034.1 purine-nucleoside phosphorylase [Bdellovibrionales bacterium]
MYKKLKEAAQYIKTVTNVVPRVGLVLGSGLGAFVERIQNPIIIPYGKIPHFKDCTVEGHEGRLILGTIAGVPCVVLQGRLHVYEGHPMEDIVFPTRVMATLGIEILILTNAAGGINPTFRPGDLVLIEDHINLMGQNPLVGPNIAELGPRFPDMTEAYAKDLRNIFQKAYLNLGREIKKGVYLALLGPTYETPAEIRMLKIMGADMVGMSTVPEAIAANHLGLKVCGISCITNMAAGIEQKALSHDDVKAMAAKVMEQFSNLLCEGITLIKEQKF